jgi:hypothetical protein
MIDAFDAAVGYCHAIEVRRNRDGTIEGFAAATDPRSEGRPAAY